MLTIKDLSFSYQKGVPLFRNLSLHLKAGHIYGLLGKNGAGKSTLLKNMIGLAYPTKGVCMLNGLDVSKRPVQVLSNLFFIAEEIYVPAVSPIRFAETTAGFYPHFNMSQFYQYLNLLEVEPQTLLTQQSHGEQKKAMIAFGLAANASLLVLDEPTNGLDIPSKSQFRKLIASVQTENRCIIISTHQVRDLDNLIDTLLVLHQKEIVVNKSLDEVGEKLSFGVYSDDPGVPVLYEEDHIRGKNLILANTTGEFSRVDLESLFNAITSGHKAVIQILNGTVHE